MSRVEGSWYVNCSERWLIEAQKAGSWKKVSTLHQMFFSSSTVDRRKPAPAGMYKNPLKNGMNYLSTGEAFLPSTVSLLFHSRVFVEYDSKITSTYPSCLKIRRCSCCMAIPCYPDGARISLAGELWGAAGSAVECAVTGVDCPIRNAVRYTCVVYVEDCESGPGTHGSESDVYICRERKPYNVYSCINKCVKNIYAWSNEDIFR